MSTRKLQTQRPSGTKQIDRPSPQRPAAPADNAHPKWVWRLCSAVLIPAALLLLAEGVLRLLNFGYPVSFFLQSKPGEVVSNEKFAWRYYGRETALKPFLFKMQAHKPPGTIRICILGDSAAMGTPDPAFGFGRMLEVQLRHRYPGKHIEVINAAMRGIDSYIVRTIAHECATYDVDLFVVYTGNNEVIGLHGPSPGTPALAQWPPLIAARDWALSTRLGQSFAILLGRLAHSDVKTVQDMDYFRRHCVRAGDSRRHKVRHAYANNLRHLCHDASRSGAKTVLCTVPVNLHDFPPLQSLHQPNLTEQQLARWDKALAAAVAFEKSGLWTNALEAFQTAAAVDDQFAELHFHLARCYEALGSFPQAAREYALARDWDALQFRMDTPMNGVVKSEVAAGSSTGVGLLDLERTLAADVDHGVPGKTLFADHVHPTFAGNYFISLELEHWVAESFAATLGKPAGDCLTQTALAAALPYTLYDDLNVTAAMVRLTSEPPFLDQLAHAERQSAVESEIRARLNAFSMTDAKACIEAYRAALQREPDYWPTRLNLGSLSDEIGQSALARECFGQLVAEFPDCKKFRLALAQSLMKSGDQSGGLSQLEAALRLEPFDQELRQAVLKLRPQN